MPKNVERYSISVSSPDRVESVEEKISLLTRNLFRQYDKLNELILLYTSGREKFELTPALILKLHYFAMESIVPDAGKFRSRDVIISVSGHSPPPAEEVPRLVQELCDYVRVNWFEKSALHLASYCLWRLNWIHLSPKEMGLRRGLCPISCLALGWASDCLATTLFRPKLARARRSTTALWNMPTRPTDAVR
jgi:hypothetical protein